MARRKYEKPALVFEDVLQSVVAIRRLSDHGNGIDNGYGDPNGNGNNGDTNGNGDNGSLPL